MKRNLVISQGTNRRTVLGGSQYIIGFWNVASDVMIDYKFHYFDYLELLDITMVPGLLIRYDYWSHVPNDIGVDQLYLPPECTQVQSHLNNVQSWSDANLVKLNERKSNFIIFTRSQTQFTTRLSLNNTNLQQLHEIKLSCTIYKRPTDKDITIFSFHTILYKNIYISTSS